MDEANKSVVTERSISIHFHPFRFEDNAHAVEKAENGIKRKYLYGISSGIMRDGQGERMTENCIKSMMEQGKSGNVLLYAGLHGVKFHEDIGILVDSSIDESGNWLTTYRLYDESDLASVGRKSIEEATKVWAQINGLSPYKKPIQKGFSIEGTVPEDQILDKTVNEDGSWTNRVINDMRLDGVVVVNRPAYQDSVVTAIYKCLQEYTPESKERIQKKYCSVLSETINQRKEKRNFYQSFYEINSVLEEKISDIMSLPETDGRILQRLDILFDEYKAISIGLLQQNAEVFPKSTVISNEPQSQENTVVMRQRELYKELAVSTRKLSNFYLKRLGGLQNANTNRQSK